MIHYFKYFNWEDNWADVLLALFVIAMLVLGVMMVDVMQAEHAFQAEVCAELAEAGHTVRIVEGDCMYKQDGLWYFAVEQNSDSNTVVRPLPIIIH